MTTVDSDDYEALAKYKWYRSRWGYAHRQGWRRTESGDREHWTIWMHRVVNKTPDGLYTDHINHNKLDNRKENLRTVDKSQNSANRPKAKRTKTVRLSQYKGVSYNRRANLWEASVSRKGRQRTTYHRTEAQAALDYNRMATEVFGDCAFHNEIPPGTEPTVRRKKSSRFFGVSFVRRAPEGKQWRASIEIGCYATEHDAARAYNDAARKIRGENTRLNEL